MRNMTIKSKFATAVGKSAFWYLHKFRNGGTSYPGVLATKLDPNVLADLAKDYELIIVTGTNGKTMTTSLLVEALRKQYDDVLTNPSGSNMIQGITTAFLSHKKAKTTKKRIAVLEVDEANVPIITAIVKPKAFVLTNLFRDQMDRYGEIYTTYDKIVSGIKLAPEALVIANGDASIFSSRKLPNKFCYYGVATKEEDKTADFKAPTNTDGVLCPVCNHILHYHALSYANLGDYFCVNCGFKRPELTHVVTKIGKLTPNSINFEIENQELTMPIGGKYNIYNALTAYSVAREFDVPAAKIIEALTGSQRLFGRQELIQVNDHEINLILVKNPVGLNEIVDLINEEDDDYSLVALLNAQHADGIDTSWIWDGNLELLNRAKIKQLIVGGERFHDMALRLEVAGFDPATMEIVDSIPNVLETIKDAKTKKVYILSTYTAMLALRKKMADEKIIAGNME